MSDTVILWLRQDLRLTDLPALQAAARDGAKVLPVYILDEEAGEDWRPGGASRWWLHYSLESLARGIADVGGRLMLRRGDSLSLLRELSARHGVTQIYCSRRYEPWAARQESVIRDALGADDIGFKRYPGTLLHEPGSVLTQGGGPFKVFTPFWRACQRQLVHAPLAAPAVNWFDDVPGDALDSWQLRPSHPDWAANWSELWSPGEAGARQRLLGFLDSSVDDYADDRNVPAIDATSKLSPHLHHGEISPRQIWQLCENYKAEHPGSDAAVAKFQAELGWREFSYHLLHDFPNIPEKPFKANFAEFPWQPDRVAIKRWQQGQTGYPIVDAGMRELWQTGYMHNRVRMVVASFLCKHLLQHWREGANWFWDTLVDADLASNSCSWQWVAGSGADAAPYFRIFNPVTQGEKFDKRADYVRRWVPEIAALPDKYIHKPWEAPENVLLAAKLQLGDTYPEPMVDHRAARQGALDAYQVIRLSKAAAP